MSEVNKIANYNQMMSWLTRPSTPQTETRENFAIGGGEFEGEDLGTREGFATISKKPLSKEKFIELYENFLNTDEVNKSDRVFAEKLNKEGYRTQSNDPFDDGSIFARRKRYGVKGVVEGSKAAPEVAKKVQNVNEYLSDLIFELNSKNRFYSLEEVQDMVREKFKFSKNVSFDKRNYPIFNQLLNRDQKVEQLLKKMLISDEPLNTSFLKYIAKEVGGARRKKGRTGPLVENELEFKTVQKALKNSPTYKIIKDQGADLLKDRFNKGSADLFKLSFSDQLEEALDLAKGQPVFTGMDKEKYYSSSPKHKVMEFAKRSWNTSKGKGPIKFFNSKGDEITWQRGIKLPYRKVSFSYDGKNYNMKELDNINVVKNNFPEVYEKQTAVNRLRAVDVDNPYGKNKIPLLDLLKENSRKIYGWSPRRNTFDVLHGIDGVGVKPFTDLSFNSRDVNQMQLGVSNTFKANKISKKDFDIISSTMNEYTGGGDPTKIQKRQQDLAKNFLSGKVKSYDDERNRIIKANKARNAFKNYAKSINLQARIPGLTDLFEMARDIPGDLKKAKYISAGLKTLGVVATPLVAYDTYKAFEEGKPAFEALEQGFIGTNLIGSAKDLMALSPEEREARSVVKQAEMTDQIAQDESMLDTDFETPKVKSDLTREEAEEKFEAAKTRRKLERESQEADIAKARATSIQGLKDLITGKRFAGQEMPTQYMAAGGRMGFADGPDDPSRRKFMKIAGGIASIPIVGKFLKPAMVAAPKVVEVVKRGVDGTPEFLGDLITKIVTFGKKNFTGNRADEFADQYRLDDYVVTQQGNKTTIQKFDDPDNPNYKEIEIELETDPETGGVTYNEASVRPDAEGKLKDVEEYIDDLDLEDMKKYTYDE